MLVQRERLSRGPGAWAGFGRDTLLAPGSFMGRKAPRPGPRSGVCCEEEGAPRPSCLPPGSPFLF